MESLPSTMKMLQVVWALMMVAKTGQGQRVTVSRFQNQILPHKSGEWSFFFCGQCKANWAFWFVYIELLALFWGPFDFYRSSEFLLLFVFFSSLCIYEFCFIVVTTPQVDFVCLTLECVACISLALVVSMYLWDTHV